MLEERLKLLRNQNNMTQKELARELGISPSTVGMYEKGNRTPAPDMLKKIAKLFDVSIDYLLGNTNITVIKPHNQDELPALLSREEMDLILQYRDFNKEEKIDIQDYINFKAMKKANKHQMSSTSVSQK